MPTATARGGPLASGLVSAPFDTPNSRSPQRKRRKSAAAPGNSSNISSPLFSDFTQPSSSTASSKLQDCLVTFADQYTSINTSSNTTMAYQEPIAGNYFRNRSMRETSMRDRQHPPSASVLPHVGPGTDWQSLYYQQQRAMDESQRLHRLESETLRVEIDDLTAQLQKIRNDSGYSTGTLHSGLFGGKENDKVFPDLNTIRASKESLQQIRQPSLVSPGGHSVAGAVPSTGRTLNYINRQTNHPSGLGSIYESPPNYNAGPQNFNASPQNLNVNTGPQNFSASPGSSQYPPGGFSMSTQDAYYTTMKPYAGPPMPGHVEPTDSPIGDVEIAAPTTSGPVSPPTTLVNQIPATAAPPHPIGAPQGQSHGPIIGRTPVWRPQSQRPHSQSCPPRSEPEQFPPRPAGWTSESREDIPGYSNSDSSEEETSLIDHNEGIFIGQGISSSPSVNPPPVNLPSAPLQAPPANPQHPPLPAPFVPRPPVNPQDPSLHAPLILPPVPTGRHEGTSKFFLEEVGRKLSANHPPAAMSAKQWAENLPSELASPDHQVVEASSPVADNSAMPGASTEPEPAHDSGTLRDAAMIDDTSSVPGPSNEPGPSTEPWPAHDSGIQRDTAMTDDSSAVPGPSSEPWPAHDSGAQHDAEMTDEILPAQTLDGSSDPDRLPKLKTGTSNFGEPLGSLGKLSPHGKGKGKVPDEREPW